MSNRIISIGLEGMRGYAVTAEANVRSEKESCVIIGLPDAPMKESKERILSCLHQLDIDVSMKKITVHLSPADQRKTGTGHDCAMLVAVLYEVIEGLAPLKKQTCFLAGLSLAGDLVPFHGMIPAIQQALALGYRHIIVPPIDLSYFADYHHDSFVRLHSLTDLVSFLKGQEQLAMLETDLIQLGRNELPTEEVLHQTDFSDIHGQSEEGT